MRILLRDSRLGPMPSEVARFNAKCLQSQSVTDEREFIRCSGGVTGVID